MKILFLTKTLTKGGAASGALNLLNALRSAGANVIVLDAYAEQARHPIRLLRTVERVFERVFFDGETHCLRLGPPVFDMVRLDRKHRPDIIQLCDASGNTIQFTHISKVSCPVIHRMSDFWPYHGAHHYADIPQGQPDLADRLLRATIFDGGHVPDVRVAPSQWLADSLVGGDRIQTIRNAVSLPEDIRVRRTGRKPLRFGFISNTVMDPRKDFSVLPSLLASFASAQPNGVALDVFGRLARSEVPVIQGVELRLHPPFTRADLARVYASFDILLCPSRRDNSPNVVTEALANGVPVIAQSGTGMDTYLTPETGALLDFFANPNDAKMAFAQAAERIATNYAHFSRNARTYAEVELSPKAIGELYLNLYRNAISERLKCLNSE